MRIRKEVMPFIVIWAGVVSLLMIGCFFVNPVMLIALALPIGVLGGGYLLYFFRDPVRTPPGDKNALLAPADGVVAAIKIFSPHDLMAIKSMQDLNVQDLARLQEGDVMRLSIFLSLMNVHVNRFPIGGKSRFLGYFPGKHFFTFHEKSSDHNQHNSILVENKFVVCLMNQIVGPVCRRVVYWPDHDKEVDAVAGAPFGMMKFGSRLDLYLPADALDLMVSEGDRVVAGETIIAKVKQS